MNNPRNRFTLGRAMAATVAIAAMAQLAACSVARLQSQNDGGPDLVPARLAESTAPANVVEPQRAPGSCHYRGRGLYSEPDPRCTPGALNPDVNQATIGSTICREGWTATVRPPERVTEPEKRASMAAYGNGGRLSGVSSTTSYPREGVAGRVFRLLVLSSACRQRRRDEVSVVERDARVHRKRVVGQRVRFGCRERRRTARDIGW